MNDTENAYCRLCAELKSFDQLINLHSDEERWQEIVSKLTRFNIQMDVNNSNILPKVACSPCVNTLQTCIDFVTAVELAQSSLNDVVLKQDVKKEDVSEDEVIISENKAIISENEAIIYEPPESFDDSDIDNIKQETEEKLSNSCETQEHSTENTKEKVVCNSLDTVPLSQLNLSWKGFNWICSYCDTQFPTIDELRTHSMQYHTACNPYRCGDCRKRMFHLDKFIVHVKRHMQYLKFSCYKCFTEFKSLLDGVKHRKTHTTSKFVCHGCNTSFQNQKELNNHTSTYKRDIKIREMPIPLPNTDGLTCSICRKSYKSKASFTVHFLRHTDRKKDQTCEICGKCFYYKSGLVGHMILHTDARPHKCEICKASFKTSKQLRYHIGVHEGIKPFSCEQCGKCFRLKTQLNNHSIIHTDSLPHVCTFCNKRFRFKTILNQHVRQHTGDRPYSCAVCEREFTNWSNYNKHMKRRHDMDMAKSKRTPEGTYPIDPATGEVVNHEKEKNTEWKQKILSCKRRKKTNK